jgi:hypothetical protein
VIIFKPFIFLFAAIYKQPFGRFFNQGANQIVLVGLSLPNI